MIKKLFILLGLTMGVAHAQSFKIKLDSPIFSASSDSLIENSNTTNNGLKHEVSLNLNNLKGAQNSNAFCFQVENSIVFANKSVSCSAGSTPDRIKITVPLSLAYDIDAGLQINMVGFQQNNGVMIDPLLNVMIGNTVLTHNGAMISEFSNISSIAGNIKSAGYGGVANNRNANISFEVPYKGNTFKSERSSIIKIFTIIQSI